MARCIPTLPVRRLEPPLVVAATPDVPKDPRTVFRVVDERSVKRQMRLPLGRKVARVASKQGRKLVRKAVQSKSGKRVKRTVTKMATKTANKIIKAI